MERLLSGKQLYNYRTHRLRSNLRDDLQARAVLLEAQRLAADLHKELVLRYLEKKLLGRVFNDTNG